MEAEASPPVGSPPCFLWFQRPGVYKDEKGRIWVAVALQINPSLRARGSGAPESTHEVTITVHLWQLPSQMPRPPSCLFVSGLPMKWELYPGRRYQGTDSRRWEIVDHGQANPAGPVSSARILMHLLIGLHT
ncbi:T-cell leukemia/lymphoma protein 1B [Dama dama]|uniref:T-cell leukemia/lymphoma protein 1B n=1 Tax=Dama dama TaxID=30532 RepID=UPI002A36EBD1|nr:T-cell leukemia/lymphoma protein 1B [Dama dama]